MKNYEMRPEDVQIFSDNLGAEIEVLEEEIEGNKKEKENLLRHGSHTNMMEVDRLSDVDEEMKKAIETLKQVNIVVDEVLLRVDEKVGFISNTHEFIYNEEECDKSMKAIDKKFSFDPLDGILDFSNEYEHFCGKMKRQEAMDIVAVKDHKKKQEDNENFNINSGKMETLQESIIKTNKELKDMWDEINMRYEVVFGDLKGGKLIDEILSEYDIEFDTDSEIHSNMMYNMNPSDMYSISSDVFDILKAKASKKQWDTFTKYFDVDIVDDICEVKIKYEEFEDLLRTNPNVLDEIWKFFDDVGIEGIHKLDDVTKLPKGWETSGKYISIGGYVIDGVVLINGLKNHDWSQVGGVVGEIAGGALAGWAIGGVVDGPFPFGDVIGIIIGGIIGGIKGSQIGELFE